MMCEEMIFEYWFSTIRKLSARKKYLLRELIGSGKKIYYIEETEITGIEFLTEEEKIKMCELCKVGIYFFDTILFGIYYFSVNSVAFHFL